MLVSNYTTNEVITIKLLTGEEIIGYFVNQDGDALTLRKPIVPVPTGEGSIGFAPFLLTSDYLQTGNAGEIEFSMQSIVTTMRTSKQFADAYSQQVSGIDTSQSKKPGLIL